MTQFIFKPGKKWLFIFLAAFYSPVSAQTDWQNWNSIEVQANVTSKFSLKTSHLRSNDISNKYQAVFSQTGFHAGYELNRRWDLQSGVQLLTPASSKNTRTRIYVRAAHTLRISGKVNWTNSIRIETNSKAENRFRQRFIFTTRFGLRKRLQFLNLAPSIAYTLFYNVGGDSLAYYNKEAAFLIKQTPDGLHRSRLTLNLNSKINDYLRLNLYFMSQREFNFLSPETRKMNVYDPVRNRILRPFNNYNAIGIALQFNIDPLLKK